MRRQKFDIQNKTHANLLLNKIEKMEFANFQSKPSNSLCLRQLNIFVNHLEVFVNCFLNNVFYSTGIKKIISTKYRGKVQNRNLSVIWPPKEINDNSFKGTNCHGQTCCS